MLKNPGTLTGHGHVLPCVNKPLSLTFVPPVTTYLPTSLRNSFAPTTWPYCAQTRRPNACDETTTYATEKFREFID